MSLNYEGGRKMAEFIDVMGAAELAGGQIKKVTVGSEKVLVAHVGDSFFAVQNRCQHMGGDLSMGTLNGTIVTCPVHHSQYDLKDGHVVRWTDWAGLKLSLARIAKPARPLKTYHVKIEGDRILVESEKVAVGIKP